MSALETAEVFYEMHFWCCFSWGNQWVLQWVTGCCRETGFFTFIPGRTLIIISDVWYQDKPQLCWECVSPGSKNTDAVRTAERLVTAPTSLPFLREEDRGRYLYPFFPWRLNSEQEVCLHLATSSSVTRCYLRAGTLSVNRRVFIMCCALCIFDCTAVDCPTVAEWMFPWCSGIKTVYLAAVAVNLHSFAISPGW